MKPTNADIEQRLRQALPHATLEILDESHLHAGHAGASGGAGHFRVRIQAPDFAGLSLVMRHRLVYDALRDWMPERIHALAIEASV
jgi:BolA family transcriptional regulator, general stress-responsive regulator